MRNLKLNKALSVTILFTSLLGHAQEGRHPAPTTHASYLNRAQLHAIGLEVRGGLYDDGRRFVELRGSLPSQCIEKLAVQPNADHSPRGLIVKAQSDFNSCVETCESTPNAEGCARTETRYQNLVYSNDRESDAVALLAETRDGQLAVLDTIVRESTARRASGTRTTNNDRDERKERERTARQQRLDLERMIRVCRRNEEELEVATEALSVLCDITGEDRHCRESRLYQELIKASLDVKKREAQRVRDPYELYGIITDILFEASEHPEMERLYGSVLVDLIKKYAERSIREEQRYSRSSDGLNLDGIIDDLNAIKDEMEIAFESQNYSQQVSALINSAERLVAQQEARQRQQELQSIVSRGFTGRGYSSEFTAFIQQEYQLAMQRAQLACSMQGAAQQCQQARQDLATIQALPQQAQLAYQREQLESRFGSSSSSFFGGSSLTSSNNSSTPTIQTQGGIGAQSIFNNGNANVNSAYGTIPAMNISNNIFSNNQTGTLQQNNSPNQLVFPTVGSTGLNTTGQNPFAVQPQYQSNI